MEYRNDTPWNPTTSMKNGMIFTCFKGIYFTSWKIDHLGLPWLVEIATLNRIWWAAHCFYKKRCEQKLRYHEVTWGAISQIMPQKFTKNWNKKVSQIFEEIHSPKHLAVLFIPKKENHLPTPRISGLYLGVLRLGIWKTSTISQQIFGRLDPQTSLGTSQMVSMRFHRSPLGRVEG